MRAFMAHHQGMTIAAIANAALNGIMRTRFHADPLIEATELLLQERASRRRDERPGPTRRAQACGPTRWMRHLREAGASRPRRPRYRVPTCYATAAMP